MSVWFLIWPVKNSVNRLLERKCTHVVTSSQFMWPGMSPCSRTWHSGGRTRLQAPQGHSGPPATIVSNIFDVLQELQGVHNVDGCSAIPSEFLPFLWMNFSISCLCVLWRCLFGRLYESNSLITPYVFVGTVSVLPQLIQRESFQIFTCCSLTSSHDLR